MVLQGRGWLAGVVGWMLMFSGCSAAGTSAPVVRPQRLPARSTTVREVLPNRVAKLVKEEVARPRFPVPDGLRVQVDFWSDIFTRYSERQVVIHDAAHLDRVYTVLDFRHLGQLGWSKAQIAREVRNSVKREKRRVRAVLLKLSKRRGRAATTEERRVAALFPAETTAREFRRAADDRRLRAQPGLRERFAHGLEVGHAYFPSMERIFREEGVPVEITRLPLVESSFNIHAYSRRGAAGVWQFMPATGRLFMRVDSVIDERRDPLISARAAARFLERNHDRLGTWPLAITAYNHGPVGMERAVRSTGTTDIVTIVNRYRSRTFKFASRNFYAEFLAALHAEREAERHFGHLNLESLVPFDVVRPAHFVSIGSMAACAGTSPEAVAELNPSLSRNVRRGKQWVPRGYPIRVPVGGAAVFGECYAKLPAAKKYSKQKNLYVVHRVRRGQTLSAIARRYGSSVERIRRYNRLRSKHMIRIGQRLRIPIS